jgi:uncharacterized protein with FMN-binding domain
MLIGGGAMLHFKNQYNKLMQEIDEEFAAMDKIDLTTIENGNYQYRFGRIPNIVDLTVTVDNNKITSITINEQLSGPGYDALETIDRILVKQQPKVEAVTGATSSSKVIMIAVQKALTEEREK